MEKFINRFPHYNVLDKWDTPSWNAVTRKVVGERLGHIPARQFFDPHAYETLEAVCGRIIPQPDRPYLSVPIAPFIDQKMEKNRTDGTHYAGLPSMQESWQLGLTGIDEESRAAFDAAFIDLSPQQQDEVLGRVQRGQVDGGSWKSLPPQQFFRHRLLHDIVSVYYAHPKAWNEIGYGGPASPRGYLRFEIDRSDPWEAVEEAKEE